MINSLSYNFIPNLSATNFPIYLPPEPYSLEIVITSFLSNLFVTSASSKIASFLDVFLLRFFISKNNNVQASINAIPSATGPAAKTPVNPKIPPNINIEGINNIICLDNDNKALFELFPIAWKNIPDGIWTPLHMHNNKYVLKAIQANSM